MKIQFLGAAREVGRSCILVDDTYLLDCGIKISSEGQEYPQLPNVAKIKAAFLSHGHLDHCGAFPYFNFKGLNCNIYCTSMTKKIAKILLHDSIHIEMLSTREPAYSEDNISNVLGLMNEVKFHHPFSIEKGTAEFLDAGHIPGSSSVLLTINDKKILYTGDINTSTTNLMEGLRYQLQDIEVMICETTYGDREHPDRNESENNFLNGIEATLKQKGKVLIPCFSVGRAQEVILMLGKRKINVPIYVDGMAKKVTKIVLQQPEYLRNGHALRKASEAIKTIKSSRQRAEVVKEQCIVVTTSGMCVGGPVLDYIKLLYHDEKTGIFLTGYQAEGSNGRLLMEEQKAFVDGMMLNVKCHIEKFDFSAHCGRKELVALINDIQPKHLILNHGDEEAMESIKKEFSKKMKVYTPELNQTITIV
ncbi:MBL fold metallo-hydrolase [Candidatus Woesearchaeota archaeon]|nr:MBL fold metallo-hydrolase [Candidatus Woesearchaeota archaeon]